MKQYVQPFKITKVISEQFSPVSLMVFLLINFPPLFLPKILSQDHHSFSFLRVHKNVPIRFHSVLISTTNVLSMIFQFWELFNDTSSWIHWFAVPYDCLSGPCLTCQRCSWSIRNPWMPDCTYGHVSKHTSWGCR